MLATDWSIVANVLVAIGTLGLAGATVVLAYQSHRGIAVQEDALVAAQRPFVYPYSTEAWLRDVAAHNPVMLLKNGGSGPAFNVQGSLYWAGGAGGASAISQTALAAGDDAQVEILGEGIQVNFNAARGYLLYTDSAGIEWQTHFRYAGTVGLMANGTLRVDILAAGRTTELGEPQYNADGWVNAPADVAAR